MTTFYRHSLSILFVLAALVCTSCEDEQNLNTLPATVSMGKPSYSVKESKGLFTLPLTASGERNGDIIVDIRVATDEGCVEDTHFLVTSKQIILPASKETVNVEVKAIDDRAINDDRSFSIEIVSAKGATVSSENARTVVTLLDNDDIPYDRMAGVWTVTAVNEIADNGPETVSWNTVLTTVIDDEEEGYGRTITMSPWRLWNGETYEGVFPITHTLTFHYNTGTQSASVDIKLGEVMCSGVILGGENEDGLNLTDVSMLSATPTQMGYTYNGTVIGTVNEDFNRITFNLPLMGVLEDANNVAFSYWFWYSSIVMTRE